MVSTAAFYARVRGSVPGPGGLKETKLFLPHPRVKVSIVGSLRDREVACSASDRQGSNFESCVWRTVSSQSSHHPQEVLLAQFSLYVHKGGLKPDSFQFCLRSLCLILSNVPPGFKTSKMILTSSFLHLIPLTLHFSYIQRYPWSWPELYYRNFFAWQVLLTSALAWVVSLILQFCDWEPEPVLCLCILVPFRGRNV